MYIFFESWIKLLGKNIIIIIIIIFIITVIIIIEGHTSYNVRCKNIFINTVIYLE